MSQRVVFVLFLLLCYHASWLVCADKISSSAEKRVTLFKRGETEILYEDLEGKCYKKAVHSFRIPSLVDVDGVMVAVADARYVESYDNTFIDTVVKYSVDNGTTWETQVAIRNNRVRNISRVVDPTVIVKDNKIYIFVGSYNTSTTYWGKHDGSDWDPLLAVGEVKKTITDDGKLTANIIWNKPQKMKYKAPRYIGFAPLQQFLGGVGVAIVTTNGTLVFPIQIKNTRGHFYSSIIYSTDDGKTWTIPNGVTDQGCTEPVVLEWEGKLILNTRVDYSPRKVYESNNMGAAWTEVRTTLSRVWGNAPSRKEPGSQSAFIRVEILGKPVMLFTHPLNHKGKWERDKLHLWVTDNNRIFDVGQISIGDENAAYSSLLYKGDKLYCLHEINHGERYSLVFLDLIEELDLIKSVVKTWIDQDKNLRDICTPIDVKKDSGESDCGIPFPTSGLVGFLSDKFENDSWKDAYRCVDAEVIHAEKVSDGLKFKGGVGAGARWPVNKQGQNQRYHFVNFVFTLVATVRIDEEPTTESPVPLLGVSLDDRDTNKILALSYSKGGRWNPIYGMNSQRTGFWELHKTYQVVFTFGNNFGSIYINGTALYGSGKRLRIYAWVPDVSHIYIGGNGNKHRNVHSVSYVTVSNVLLYNRVLNPSEIKALLAIKDTNVASAKKRPTAEVPKEPTTSLSPTSPLPQSTVNRNEITSQSESSKPTTEGVQTPNTDRNSAPSPEKTADPEITTVGTETISVPIGSPVEDGNKDGNNQDVNHGSTAQTNDNGAVNRTDSSSGSSDTRNNPSAGKPENSESTTVINNNNSNNRDTSNVLENNEIKNVSPSESPETEKEESSTNTMDVSNNSTVTPTETTNQSVDEPNKHTHDNNSDTPVDSGNVAVGNTDDSNISSSNNDERAAGQSETSSVPDVLVEKEEGDNKSNSDSNNRGTSIVHENNEIKNVSTSESPETEEESSTNTMDVSNNSTVTPTETTNQSVDEPNKHVHHVSKLPGANKSFYFTSSLPLLVLLGSILVVVLF